MVKRKTALITTLVEVGRFKNFNENSYFLEASTDAFLNSLNILLNSSADLRALVPAALFPFSTCAAASDWKDSNSALILSTKFFILCYLIKFIRHTKIVFTSIKASF